MDKIIVTPLQIIGHPKGDILHGLKSSDSAYHGFGEAYFSTINHNEVKAWKLHTKMISNIIVPIGKVEFAFFDTKSFSSVIVSRENYARITIFPNVWFGFKGLGTYNVILNLANIEHNPLESISKNIEDFNFEWTQAD